MVAKKTKSDFKVRNKEWIIVLIIIIGIMFWFNKVVPFDSFAYDSDPNLCLDDTADIVARNLIKRHYDVIDSRIEDGVGIVEMYAKGDKGSLGAELQIWEGLQFQNIMYELEYEMGDLEYLCKKDLRRLGVDPNEAPYMSQEEYEVISEKIAHKYIVKLHYPTEICSYSLSRDTYISWAKYLERCSVSPISSRDCVIYYSLDAEQDKEISESEVCSYV